MHQLGRSGQGIDSLDLRRGGCEGGAQLGHRWVLCHHRARICLGATAHLRRTWRASLSSGEVRTWNGRAMNGTERRSVVVLLCQSSYTSTALRQNVINNTGNGCGREASCVRVSGRSVDMASQLVGGTVTEVTWKMDCLSSVRHIRAVPPESGRDENHKRRDTRVDGV